MPNFIETISHRFNQFTQLINHQGSLLGYIEPIIQQFKPLWRADSGLAKVVAITNHSVNSYSLTLKPQHTFKPFTAGDYVAVTVMKNGAWFTRYFTISSSPAHFQQTGLIELSIRQQGNDGITALLRTLTYADHINISQAQGNFHLSNSHGYQKTLMVAAGSGITPFRAMLQQLYLSQQKDHQAYAPITLLYYARANEFLFTQELQEFEQAGLVTVHFINSQQEGHFCQQHLLQYCPDSSQRKAYLCGPGTMITDAQALLMEQGVSANNIHHEYFGPNLSAHTPDNHEKQFINFHSLPELVSAGSNKTLLQIAQEQGLNPVSGCGMGVCHQCICQKDNGVVRNIQTGELSDKGASEIQLCISQAVGHVSLSL